MKDRPREMNETKLAGIIDMESEFKGDLTFKGSFRIEGTFKGGGMRAWDVVWGRGQAHVVIQHSYVDVTGGVVRDGASEIRADGRFSLGFPRKDGGEEIDARVTIKDRPLENLRHAFELDDWPLDGKVSGEFRLYDRYTRPVGSCRPVCPWSVKYRSPLEAKCRSLSPLKPSLYWVSSTVSTRPRFSSSVSSPRL